MSFQQPKTLAAAALANVETGVLLLCKEALQTAIDDARLDRTHLKVLARVAKYINGRTAKAWPDRRTIAAEIGVEPVTVSNKLRELKLWGYLIGERERVAEASNRSMMVYTFGNIDHETIRREIQSYIDRINKVTEDGDYQKSPGAVTVTGGGDSRTSKVTVGSDFVGPKVTGGGCRKSPGAVDSNSYKELIEESKLVIASPSAQPQSRATRLPSDWQLPKPWGDWTLSQFPGLSPAQVRDEGHRFHDYWVAKSGRDATKLDWLATWRNWCRNAKWPAPKEAELQKISRMVDQAFDRMFPDTTPKQLRLTDER